MSGLNAPQRRRRLRSVLRRGHLGVALVAVTLASASMTLLGVLALKVYADHNLHLIARSINYTVEAAVVFDDPGAATEALALIASTEAVAEAQVYTAEGELLAQWQRPQTDLLSRVEMLLADGLLQQPISMPILHQGQEVGRVVLRGHGANMLRFLLSGLLGVLVCTALSAWSALYLSRRLLMALPGLCSSWRKWLTLPVVNVRSIVAYRPRILPSSIVWATTSMPCSTSWSHGKAICKTKMRPWLIRPATIRSPTCLTAPTLKPG